MGLRETILACRDDRHETVKVPAWNNAALTLRVLSGVEMETAFKRALEAGVHASVAIVIASATDEAGDRVFRDGDELAFAALPYVQTAELRRVAMKLNGFGEAGESDAEKN